MESKLTVKEIATIYRRIAKKYEEDESALWYQIKGSCIKKDLLHSVIKQAIAQFNGKQDSLAGGVKMWDRNRAFQKDATRWYDKKNEICRL